VIGLRFEAGCAQVQPVRAEPQELMSMKSRNTLIRSKKFQADEKRRKVAQMEAMIADFQRMAADLEREILTEQERAGIHDPSHFAYPTYAKAAIARRENLKRSIDELVVQLGDARIELQECCDELKKVELLDERNQFRDRSDDDADFKALAGLRPRGALA
jgi:flagellar protein FliJ